MGFAHGWVRMVFRMSLGVIPIFWLEFLRVLEKKKLKKEKPGKFGIFEPLRRSEGCVALQRRGKATVHKGQNFYFVSKSCVFMHR